VHWYDLDEREVLSELADTPYHHDAGP
jgi:hypothetical protein